MKKLARVLSGVVVLVGLGAALLVWRDLASRPETVPDMPSIPSAPAHEREDGGKEAIAPLNAPVSRDTTPAPETARELTRVPTTPIQEGDDGAEKKVVALNTRYGLVRFKEDEPEISVDGTSVYESAEADSLRNRGDFRLSSEEVLLFEAYSTGSCACPGETFFLVLRPNKAPEIIRAPITPGEHPIRVVRQEQDAIYADFDDAGDYVEIKSPLRFVSDKVVVDKVTPALYSKSGPRLTGKDCTSLYELSKDDCSTISTERNQDCVTHANARNGIGSYAAAMREFTWLSKLPGFDETEFDRSCRTWCEGKDVSYEQFSKTVCKIKG